MAIYHLTAKTCSRASGQSARAKADYIQREGKYCRDKKEAVYLEHGNMPSWAERNPNDYWLAADTYERANGRLCKELEIALPVELNLKQQIDLARSFARHVTDGEKLPYSIAVHRGKGDNPHCHIMISERINDGLDRSPELWFKRANKKSPKKGGAVKSTALKPKDWLERTREAWAKQANRALEQAGHEARIDHRSLKAQGIDRKPQIHLGPHVCAMEEKGIQTGHAKRAIAIHEANTQIIDLEKYKEKINHERDREIIKQAERKRLRRKARQRTRAELKKHGGDAARSLRGGAERTDSRNVQHDTAPQRKHAAEVQPIRTADSEIPRGLERDQERVQGCAQSANRTQKDIQRSDDQSKEQFERGRPKIQEHSGRVQAHSRRAFDNSQARGPAINRKPHQERKEVRSKTVGDLDRDIATSLPGRVRTDALPLQGYDQRDPRKDEVKRTGDQRAASSKSLPLHQQKNLSQSKPQPKERNRNPVHEHQASTATQNPKTEKQTAETLDLASLEKDFSKEVDKQFDRVKAAADKEAVEVDRKLKLEKLRLMEHQQAKPKKPRLLGQAAYENRLEDWSKKEQDLERKIDRCKQRLSELEHYHRKEVGYGPSEGKNYAEQQAKKARPDLYQKLEQARAIEKQKQSAPPPNREHQLLIQKERKRSGYGFVQPSEQRKVCGQVIEQKTESGQAMALIRDDRNMEFTLVPWRSEYERFRKSKRVELSIQNKRVIIKEFTLGLGR